MAASRCLRGLALLLGLLLNLADLAAAQVIISADSGAPGAAEPNFDTRKPPTPTHNSDNYLQLLHLLHLLPADANERVANSLSTPASPAREAPS
jgi:hypothetical protein